MAEIQITFIKLVGWKDNNDEFQDEETLIKNEPVAWTLKNSSSVVLKESQETDRTDDNGAVKITGFERAGEEVLHLWYAIHKWENTVRLEPTAETRKGQPSAKKIVLPEYTIQIDFIDFGEMQKPQSPVAGQTVSWKINESNDGAPLTDEQGRVTIKRLEKTLAETNPTLSYQIRGQKGSIPLKFELRKKGATTESFYWAYQKQILSVVVKIVHRGDEPIITPLIGQMIDWKIYKIAPASASAEEPLAVQGTPQRSGPPIKSLEKPVPEGQPIQTGTSKVEPSGQTALLKLGGVRILKGEKLLVVYTIGGQEKIISFSRTSDNNAEQTINLSQQLSLPLIKINFKKDRASKEPIRSTDIEWKLPKARTTNTGDSGVVEIRDLDIPAESVLQLTYNFNGQDRIIKIKHNIKSRQGQPLEIDEFLEGIPIQINFKHSDKSTADQDVLWTIKDGQKRIIKQSKEGDKTDQNGSLKIENVALPDDEPLTLWYAILQIERFIDIKHTVDSKKGEPLEITQYLAGIPINITFIKAQIENLSEGAKPKTNEEITAQDKKNAIKNESVNWTLTNGKGEALKQKNGDLTDENGILIIKDVDITDEKTLTFSYEILGRKDSVKFIEMELEDIKAKDFRNGLDAKQYITPADKTASLTNPDRLWLTYETRFNWSTFLKTNQRFDLNLYRIELRKLLLIISPKTDLDDESLSALRDVFFPDIKNIEDLRALGTPPWDGKRDKSKATPTKIAANRLTNILYILYAYMPYNSRDNTTASAAIGTETKSRLHQVPLTPFSTKLDMWNTASRSSLVRVELTKPISPEQAQTPFNAEKMWKEYCDVSNLKRFLEPPADKKTELSLKNEGADFHKKFFSVKTGVNTVGFEIQEGKAKLEHNSILAALRSAYVREIERKFFPNALDDEDLLILTEIMTVTEADPNWDNWLDWKTGRSTVDRIPNPKFGDGYQIRSLKGMKHNREYFPPTSIPFVQVKDGKINKDSSVELSYTVEGKPQSETVFKQVEETEWQQFWKKHYAQPLGRAKARILLCYGLQGFGGNAQNFLLEMEDGLPNGRVVLRDMGDYALHDFVLWALFGPGSGPAPDPRGQRPGEQEEFVNKWKDAFKDLPLVKFECDVLHQYHNDWKSVDDPGSHAEFPTFTGYHRWADSGMHTFNPFCKCCESESGTNFVGHISPLWAYAMPVNPQKVTSFITYVSARTWAKAFEIETDWGIAHAKSWIRYLEAALNHNFALDWELLPIEDFLDKKNWNKPAEIAQYAHRMYQPSAYSEYVTELLETDFYVGNKNEGLSKEIALKWAALYEKMKFWEIYLGWEVENFLQTAEGQEAIRDYRKRNWGPVKPKFKIQVLDRNDKPIEEAPIRIENTKNSKKWVDTTDSNGEIHIYQDAPEHYKIWVLGYDDPISKPERSVSKLKERKLDFSFVKVSYRDGQATSAAVSSATSPSTPKPDLTLDKFNLLKDGMNYQEVVKIIGCEGTDGATEYQRENNVRRYVWEDNNLTINVVLTEDKLVGKYQSNLK